MSQIEISNTLMEKPMPEEATTDETTEVIPVEQLARRIHTIRGQNVMLDKDLAELYRVPTKSLNLAVKRNIERFPDDFMFQLNSDENRTLRFQIETSNEVRGGSRYLPYVFTEQGVAMLSSVLRSERAVQVNIAIMRAFVAMRGLLSSDDALARKILDLEQKYDHQFEIVFDAIRRLIEAPPSPERRMGFWADTTQRDT